MAHRPDHIQTVFCPRCRQEMKFVRSIPKFGPALPELHIFSCTNCGEVETREVVEPA